MDPSAQGSRPPAAKSSDGPRHGDDDVQLAGRKAATDGATEGGREGSGQRAFNTARTSASTSVPYYLLLVSFSFSTQFGALRHGGSGRKQAPRLRQRQGQCRGGHSESRRGFGSRIHCAVNRCEDLGCTPRTRESEIRVSATTFHSLWVFIPDYPRNTDIRAIFHGVMFLRISGFFSYFCILRGSTFSKT